MCTVSYYLLRRIAIITFRAHDFIYINDLAIIFSILGLTTIMTEYTFTDVSSVCLIVASKMDNSGLIYSHFILSKYYNYEVILVFSKKTR